MIFAVEISSRNIHAAHVPRDLLECIAAGIFKLFGRFFGTVGQLGVS